MATKILEDGGEAYETKGGVTVTRRRRAADYGNAISAYVDKLDERRGAVFFCVAGRHIKILIDMPDPKARQFTQDTRCTWKSRPAGAARALVDEAGAPLGLLLDPVDRGVLAELGVLLMGLAAEYAEREEA